ncbi:MAG: helix-turn-helix domain-containing protein [Candidatus Binatus sp.]|uniref:winged helix-turn-helix transcriptional regulator n=1 Tax=Candidatus Binatus sp. TaxID=2811406 RepID=UPI00271BBD92|nr:helix-turn-helix domain-containing protein [Candidatus Binatus sp.]MDO8432804.1 helix-turn-helix domain-containing protein [Candidatus Binatus sp.]
MRWNDIDQMTCSLARTLSVIGDRWTMLILRDAFLGVRRFEDFERDLQMPRHRLSERLRKLVAQKVLARVQYQLRPRRFEYRLTEKGIDLYPVIVSMLNWGDRWMAGADGPPVELIHRTCGKKIAPAFKCPECDEPIRAREMTARPGPALRKRGAAALGRLGARQPSAIDAPAAKRHAR